MTAARSKSALVVCLIALVLLCVAPQIQAADAPNCKDHPLFTRMPGMRIVSCKISDFDRFEFRTGKPAGGKQSLAPIEGKRYDIRYQLEGTGQPPSPLAIIRNHQAALKGVGGAVVFEDTRYTTLKLNKNGNEVWTQVDTAWGKGYILTIVEKQAMKQDVASNVEMFQSGIQTTGHVEVPGIFFDTGKSVLKPESKAAIADVAKLLQADPSLKVYVVGHTDNVAALEMNMKLSQARAEAVVQSLVTEHKIAAARLVARGAGPLAPVASNDSDDGRAKNRRVELVKQ